MNEEDNFAEGLRVRTEKTVAEAIEQLGACKVSGLNADIYAMFVVEVENEYGEQVSETHLAKLHDMFYALELQRTLDAYNDGDAFDFEELPYECEVKQLDFIVVIDSIAR